MTLAVRAFGFFIAIAGLAAAAISPANPPVAQVGLSAVVMGPDLISLPGPGYGLRITSRASNSAR